jgi:hypothetical protein
MGFLTKAYNRYPETVGNFVARVLHPFELTKRIAENMANAGWKLERAYESVDEELSVTDHFRIRQSLSDAAESIDVGDVKVTLYSHPAHGIVSNYSDEYMTARDEAARKARAQIAAEYFQPATPVPEAPKHG